MSALAHPALVRSLAAVVATFGMLGDCSGAEDELPRFERDIAPIFARHCLSCHGRWEKKAGLDLRSVALASRGGYPGPAIVPGDADGSRLYQRLAERTMPPPERPHLSEREIGLIGRWIDAGAAADNPERLIGAGAFQSWGIVLVVLAGLQVLAGVALSRQRGLEACAWMAALSVPLLLVATSRLVWHPPDEQVYLACGLLVFGAGIAGATVARASGASRAVGLLVGIGLSAPGVVALAWLRPASGKTRPDGAESPGSPDVVR